MAKCERHSNPLGFGILMCMDALMSREHRGEAEQKKVQRTFFPLSGRGRMPSPGFRAKQDSAAKKVRSDLPLRQSNRNGAFGPISILPVNKRLLGAPLPLAFQVGLRPLGIAPGDPRRTLGNSLVIILRLFSFCSC